MSFSKSPLLAVVALGQALVAPASESAELDERATLVFQCSHSLRVADSYAVTMISQPSTSKVVLPVLAVKFIRIVAKSLLYPTTGRKASLLVRSAATRSRSPIKVAVRAKAIPSW